MESKTILLGNVGESPKISNTKEGKKIASFSLATSESWKDKSTGEKQTKVEWHQIVVFSSGLANVVENYVKKGSKLYIEGQNQTRHWTDKDGVKRYITEVVLKGFKGVLHMLDSKKDSFASSEAKKVDEVVSVVVDEDMDDDIPF